MAALTLKNLPDDLLDALREAAENDRRSLNQHIIRLLDISVHGSATHQSARKARTDAQVAAWRRLAGRWVSSVDRATENKQLMKRRTPGRKVTL